LTIAVQSKTAKSKPSPDMVGACFFSKFSDKILLFRQAVGIIMDGSEDFKKRKENV